MLRSLVIVMAFCCISVCAYSQAGIGMELREIITLEIDSLSPEPTSQDQQPGYRLLHPFADQEALAKEYYVANRKQQTALLREDEVLVIPYL